MDLKRTTVDLTRAERCVFSLLELEHDVTFRELLSRFAGACMNHKEDVERLLFGDQHAATAISMARIESAIGDLHTQVRRWANDAAETDARREFVEAGHAALAAADTSWSEPEQKTTVRAKPQARPRRAA